MTSGILQFLCYWLLILLSVVVLALPYVANFGAQILLRDYGFRAQVCGFLSFRNVFFKYRVKMNLHALVFIRQVSVRINFPKSFDEILSRQSKNEGWLSIRVEGLQVNLMLKDDFATWGSDRVQLIEIIDKIRDKLTREGLLLKKEKRKVADTNN